MMVSFFISLPQKRDTLKKRTHPPPFLQPSMAFFAELVRHRAGQHVQRRFGHVGVRVVRP